MTERRNARPHAHPNVAPCRILEPPRQPHPTLPTPPLRPTSTKARQRRGDAVVPRDCRARSLDYVIGFQTRIKSRTNRLKYCFYTNSINGSQCHTKKKKQSLTQHAYTAKGSCDENDTSVWLFVYCTYDCSVCVAYVFIVVVLMFLFAQWRHTL